MRFGVPRGHQQSPLSTAKCQRARSSTLQSHSSWAAHTSATSAAWMISTAPKIIPRSLFCRSVSATAAAICTAPSAPSTGNVSASQNSRCVPHHAVWWFVKVTACTPLAPGFPRASNRRPLKNFNARTTSSASPSPSASPPPTRMFDLSGRL